jgi:hypothetical protein
MTKPELILSLSDWLHTFLNKNYSNEYLIETIIPENHLSKLANNTLKKIDGYTALDFHPDIISLMSNTTTNHVEVVIMNISNTAISLKEIGEMNCYSKILKSKHSFIVSTKGVPEEVNLILLNNNTMDKLLKVGNSNYIHIFRWDDDNKSIDANTIFPLKKSRLSLLNL